MYFIRTLESTIGNFEFLFALETTGDKVFEKILEILEDLLNL